MESAGWESDYQDYPINVVQTENRGRIVVSTRPIKAGEIVLLAQPYTYAVCEDHVHQICSHCLNPLPKECRMCSCGLWYCDSCLAAEHYPIECTALQKLPSHKYTTDQYSEIRMIIKIIARKLNETDPKMPYNLVLRLATNESAFDRATRDLIADMAETIASLFNGRISPDEIAGLLYRERSNAFGIWNKEACIASAVYPKASFFNHSCAPNCSRYSERPELTIRALVDIPKGMELTISYIDTKMSREARRLELSSYYHFICECERCRHDTGFAHSCPNCPGILVPVNRRKICYACDN